MYYSEYLGLDKILNAQTLESGKKEHGGKPCKEEMLFIIVHQAYELWFKQIIHEIDQVVEIFKAPPIQENKLHSVNHKLERIISIQRVLLEQVSVIETLTPMDFLEFRDLLIPASGFQSIQFREIEIKLGLDTKSRHNVEREYFIGRLSEQDRDKINELEKGPSLFSLLEGWLERLPFTKDKEFNFWEEYKQKLEHIIEEDRKIIESNKASLSPQAIEMQLSNLEATEKTFKSLFDKDLHKILVDTKRRKLSQQAILSALFIMLYREEAILNQPFKIIQNLIDIDENFTTWRYKHAMLAHRMLGTKIGTGGSSGHKYLKQAADNNKIFNDFFDLSTFLIARTSLPKLPESLLEKMNYRTT